VLLLHSCFFFTRASSSQLLLLNTCGFFTRAALLIMAGGEGAGLS
jgi:hypothetical protein